MVKPCVDDFLQDEELLEKGYVYQYRFIQSKKYFEHAKLLNLFEFKKLPIYK